MNRVSRGKKTTKVQAGGADWLDKSPEEQHRAMTWMQRLKRVFNIDIETCERCGGKVKVAAPAHPCARGISTSMHVIASIEESLPHEQSECFGYPAVIAHILKHLNQKAVAVDDTKRHTLPPERASPQTGLFDPSRSRLFD